VQADVEAVVSMCTADSVEQLLAGNPDFVLDAIDNIETKVGLLGWAGLWCCNTST
jgi:tRNA A37 threonylcarbamoyladenosine dehydratase